MQWVSNTILGKPEVFRGMCVQVFFFLASFICMALSVWFQTAEFRFNFQRPGPDDVAVRAYHAKFRRPELPSSSDPEIISLCMLHHDEIGPFPYPGRDSDEYAVNFASHNGLELIGSVSYGWVFRRHTWRPYRCCHQDWIGWYCFHCHTQH